MEVALLLKRWRRGEVWVEVREEVEKTEVEELTYTCITNVHWPEDSPAVCPFDLRERR